MKASIARAIGAMMVSAVLSTSCGSPHSPEAGMTMSAVVNGAPWSPGNLAPGQIPVSAQFNGGDSTLTISGSGVRASDSRQESISLHLTDVAGPGTYSLGDESTASYGWYITTIGLLTDPGYEFEFYRTTVVLTGSVVLTAFDPEAHTLQGTFAFQAGCCGGKTVGITAGSIDGRY